MSTYQQLFDKAAAGILAQGCQSNSTKVSVDDEGYEQVEPICAYRGDDDAKCAIGHLLTDEQMSAHNITEGKMPPYFPKALIQEILSGEDLSDLKVINCSIYGRAINFLKDLQAAHDDANETDFNFQFRMAMNEIASKWNLRGIE